VTTETALNKLKDGKMEKWKRRGKNGKMKD
jgi:hypothetical protein